ncbi:MAG: type VI secretion system tube protein TssD [Crocinitomicaceae bacterium]|nr:type VI secretion system tube protein TssD [Crocinitomicaceae bacterium]
MGSFKAKVSLNGSDKKYDVIYTSTKFFRKVGPKGKPTTRVQGGFIEFRVEAEAGVEILDAMITSEHKMISLQLDYIQTEDSSIMRTTTGEAGYITEYREMLDTTDDKQAQVYFGCHFTILNVGAVTHTNEWVMNS